MKIYRIEGPKGNGICQVTGSLYCLVYKLGCIVAGKKPDEMEHCRFCPQSAEDKAIDLAGDPAMVYGFPSLEALTTWFPTMEGRQAMHDAGARGIVYEAWAPEVFSPFQVIFNRDKAIREGLFDLVGASHV